MATKQPETVRVVNPMVRLFKSRGWTCVNMVAGFTTSGLADYWMYHPEYGERWIEFKRLNKKGNLTSSLTDAQKREFPRQYRAGVKIYCIAAYDLRGSKYFSLRKKHYYRVTQCPPNIMDLVTPLYRRNLNV